MTMEAQTILMQPQPRTTKDHGKARDARKRQEWILSWSLQRERGPADTGTQGPTSGL